MKDTLALIFPSEQPHEKSREEIENETYSYRKYVVVQSRCNHSLPAGCQGAKFGKLLKSDPHIPKEFVLFTSMKAF